MCLAFHEIHLRDGCGANHRIQLIITLKHKPCFKICLIVGTFVKKAVAPHLVDDIVNHRLVIDAESVEVCNVVEHSVIKHIIALVDCLNFCIGPFDIAEVVNACSHAKMFVDNIFSTKINAKA